MTKKILSTQIDETDDGQILFNVPLPKNPEQFKELSPIIIKQPYHIDYIHSYGQDSPWFAGLANKRLFGTKCQKCGYRFATPKLSCMECGGDCDWVEMPLEGKLHTFTVCEYASKEFLKETPFMLCLVEFEGFNALLLSRLVGIDPKEVSLDWVGMKVKAKFRRNSKFKPTDVYFVPA